MAKTIGAETQCLFRVTTANLEVRISFPLCPNNRILLTVTGTSGIHTTGTAEPAAGAAALA
jgi:hypothetical protein